MPRVSDTYTLQRTGDTVVCAISGETGNELVAELRRQMQGLMEDDALRTVVLDLAGITFMNTTGINFLIHTKRQAEAAGKTLRLCNVAGQVAKVLTLVQLGEFFDIQGAE
jgi:anti-sigma B factor antagonist